MMAEISARVVALEILNGVIYQKQNLDDVFDAKVQSLDARDRSFIRMLVTTTLRRMGQIDEALHQFMTQKLPFNALIVENILRLAICQILFMNTPHFAAVDTAVKMTRFYKKDGFVKLVNALLRQVCRQKDALQAQTNEARVNTPDWLWDSWCKTYGKAVANRIATAHLTEPETYLTCKENAANWAKKLGGSLTKTGSVQLNTNAYIPELEGFNEGAWWVQDAAAALAVQAFTDLRDKCVADFCAAPGGKTAGLIARGAKVDAFDISKNRMKRVQENLARLHYQANCYVQDANLVQGERIYDAILLDAPCSATGTIMRHPDLYFHRTAADVQKLNEAQHRLLMTAHRLLKDDGQLVYCTCSLQKQEGEDMIDSVSDLFERQEIINPIMQPFLTKNGDVRTFPYQKMDGFFISLLKKRCK